jgi:23S rRNA (cytidine2498-2'-O)-methyltransferase
MISAAESSFGSAVEELRRAFDRGIKVERLGPDVGVVAATSPTVKDIASACVHTPLVFIRHLTVELARLTPTQAQDPVAVSRVVRSIAESSATGRTLALQTWTSGESKIGYSAAELRDQLAGDLVEAGFSVMRAGQSEILSCCLSESGVSVCLNRRRSSLSDWPGGRVRLSRSSEQISRAEFKLEELLLLADVTPPSEGFALDLGGSPGGWARILRNLGLRVWVVDPGELHGTLVDDPRVQHLRTTAGEFLRDPPRRPFDMAVNDMRMSPLLSCQVMCDVAPLLRPGALSVVTLKINNRDGLDTVRRCLRLLDTEYDVIFARQLYHNRDEVTVLSRYR